MISIRSGSGFISATTTSSVAAIATAAAGGAVVVPNSSGNHSIRMIRTCSLFKGRTSTAIIPLKSTTRAITTSTTSTTIVRRTTAAVITSPTITPSSSFIATGTDVYNNSSNNHQNSDDMVLTRLALVRRHGTSRNNGTATTGTRRHFSGRSGNSSSRSDKNVSTSTSTSSLSAFAAAAVTKSTSKSSLFVGSGIGTDVEMIAANHRKLSTDSSSSSSTSHSSHSEDSSTTAPCGGTSCSSTVSSSSSSSTTTTTNEDLASKPPMRTFATHAQPQTQTTATSSSSSPTIVGTPTLKEEGTATDTAAPSSSEMKDEYGTMDDSGESYVVDNYVLENGQVLPLAELRYRTYGTLNEETRDNVLVVCHALTGNASLHSWWGDLLGPGCAFDTSKYFVVCCNILGSCYGSTSPKSINPMTQQPYGIDFPDISVQDTVRLQLKLLQEHLQIHSVKCVIGGSFGGMQAVEYAVQGGSSEYGSFFAKEEDDDEDMPFVRSCIPIACGAQHTAWQIAISEVQRQAIYKDIEWRNGNYFRATSGLEVARQMGMISYRTANGYSDKFGRDIQDPGRGTNGTEGAANTVAPAPKYGSDAYWKVKSYLEYQGVKFLDRFDPVTYVKLTEQMDSHDVTRGRNRNQSTTSSLQDVLGSVNIPVLVLGIDSDVLYPLREQEELHKHLPNSTLKVIHSEDGHDGFLLEQEQVNNYIIDFLSAHE